MGCFGITHTPCKYLLFHLTTEPFLSILIVTATENGYVTVFEATTLLKGYFANDEDTHARKTHD
jgi:hypothetical protein